MALTWTGAKKLVQDKGFPARCIDRVFDVAGYGACVVIGNVLSEAHHGAHRLLTLGLGRDRLPAGLRDVRKEMLYAFKNVVRVGPGSGPL